MMQKKMLFYFLGGDILYLADMEDIHESVYTEFCWEISGATTVEERAKIEAMNFDGMSTDEVEDAITKALGHDAELEGCGDYTILTDENEEKIYYDVESRIASKLGDFESEKTYSWWDGQKHNVMPLDWTEEILVSESYKLDRWDGRNFCFGGMGYHARVCYYTDAEREEDGFLYIEWCDYQGSLNLETVHYFTTTDEMADYLRKEHYRAYDGDMDEMQSDMAKLEEIKANELNRLSDIK